MRYVPLAERFWAHVEKTEGCWNWTAHRNSDGYGMIGLERTRRVERTHRLSWVLHNGPIPDGLQVLHRCDNPACVRPDHLWLGTQIENIADMDAKGRRRFNPARGSQLPNAKLTEADIPVIWQMIGAGVSDRLIGERFGVTRLAILLIRHGKNWKHLHPIETTV